MNFKSYEAFKAEQADKIVSDGGEDEAISYRESAASRRIGNYHAPANNPAVWAVLR